MLRVELVRVAVRDRGAFGVLKLDGLPVATTVEKTYSPDTSPVDLKIPVGTYRCTRTTFHRGGYQTFEVHVPGHSRLLFHRANTEDDLDGCIGVGQGFAMGRIVNSKIGSDYFMHLLEDVDEFELVVSECAL